MCGIVGIGDFKPRCAQFEHQVFSQLLIANALRGTDGTGIVKVFTDGQYDWRKQVGYPYHLLGSKSFGEWFRKYDELDVRFLFGHCRYGTRGETTVDNAHPFTVGDITLVHNGSLQKHSKLPDFHKFEVDSEAIANSINVQGIQATVDGMHGAYSLVWYNEKEKTLNLIRNFERPMNLAVDEFMGRVYFASEKKMLEWVLDRNNINLPKAGVQGVPTGTLVTFDLDSVVPKLQKIEAKSFFPAGFTNPILDINTNKKKDTTKLLSVKDKDIPDSAFTDHADLVDPSLPIPGEGDDKKSTKVLVLPVKYKKNKKNKGGATSSRGAEFEKVNLMHVSNLFGLVCGQRIKVDLVDYKKVMKSIDGYLLECCSQELPSVDVFMYIQGELSLDTLLETGEMSCRIVSMEYNKQNIHNARERHRVWACDPMPEFKLAEGKTYDADGFEVGASTLWDHKDSSLGD